MDRSLQHCWEDPSVYAPASAAAPGSQSWILTSSCKDTRTSLSQVARTFLSLALKISRPRNPLSLGQTRTVGHTTVSRHLLGRWNGSDVNRGLCQTIPCFRRSWCLGQRRGQGGQRAWPQARGPLNRGTLLVPARKASHARAGLYPAGHGGRGRQAPQDSG